MSRLHTLSQCHFICDLGRRRFQYCDVCKFNTATVGLGACNLAYKNMVCSKETIQAQADRLE